MSYAHCFALPQAYHREEAAIPLWALRCLQRIRNREQVDTNGSIVFEQLDTANTNDETWNAMQKYLIETGELHNNARMTWGKTALHWLAPLKGDVLWQMCCLNDRYALDGLSPPSYAGILWCFGWCDKPGPDESISTKWSYRYRSGPDAFGRAKELLMLRDHANTWRNDASPDVENSASKKPRLCSSHETGSKALLDFFAARET